MTFYQITGQELFKFTESLKCKRGANKGKPLSQSRGKYGVASEQP
jgi:hypothetical protein